MAVKVQGTVFQIRVVEEIGGWPEVSGGEKKVNGFAGEVLSKASSDGGISVAGMVVGLSDSGSDADVSESCQLLLDVEKCGGKGKGHMEDLGGIGTRLMVCQDLSPTIWVFMGSW
ncbi:hypothetical protein QL285_065067 [Trifolium repens]|nr:hypothetical protein QL285_065067 [Trifolium repens]